MRVKNIQVYTDGGCSGNPGPGGWAFVICREDGEDISRSGAEPYTTNNRMELTAVIRALAFLEESGMADESTHISVHTDSQYTQKGITEWITLWKRKNWRTSSKQPVKNRGLWEELDALSGRLKPEWFWVKGHAGNPYNELCDKLTGEAIAALQTEGKESV